MSSRTDLRGLNRPLFIVTFPWHWRFIRGPCSAYLDPRVLSSLLEGDCDAHSKLRQYDFAFAFFDCSEVTRWTL